MTKIYVNQKEVNYDEKKFDLVRFVLELMVSAITLMLAKSVFNGFYIENIWYALIASLLISALNSSLKPLLIYLTLPVTVMSLGILYPIVNVIILKITSLLMGDKFVIEEWFVAFFISIFISIVTALLRNFVLGVYKGGKE